MYCITEIIIIIHDTYKILQGQYNPCTPSLSSPGQEDWSLCTNFSLCFLISVIQYVAGSNHFSNILFIIILLNQRSFHLGVILIHIVLIYIK